MRFNIITIFPKIFNALDNGVKGKVAIDQSMQNHFEVLCDAAVNYEEATELLIILQDHIQHRLKHYTKWVQLYPLLFRMGIN